MAKLARINPNPSLTEYGFTQFSERPAITYDIDDEIVGTDYVFPEYGISGSRIESLTIDQLQAGSFRVATYAQSSNFVSGISGWKINGNGDAEFSSITLYGGTLKYGKTSFSDSTNAGYWIGSSGLYFGSALDGTYIKYDIGATTLLAKLINADIEGTITSSAGSIGGWTLATGYIYNLQSGTPTSSPNDGLVLASGNEGIICYEDTAKRVELGYLSAGIYGLKIYDTGGSNVLFETSDTQQIIAGWYFNTTSLADNTTAANAKIYIDSANTLIRVGATTGDYITVDGGNLKISSSNYVSGYAGAGFNLDPDLLEVGNIACRGLFRTAVFQKDIISVSSGNLLVTPNADVLGADMTALDTAVLTTKGTTTFAVDDILRIKDGTDDEWMTVTYAADGNLVKNADFESVPPFTAAQTLAGRYIDGTANGSTTDTTWHWWGSTFGGSTVQFDESVFYGGAASLKMVVPAGAYCQVYSNNSNTSWSNDPTMRFPIIPGHTYRFSAWIKTENMSGDSAHGVYIAMLVSKADGTSHATVIPSGYIKTNVDWTLKTVDWVATAGSAWAFARATFYGHTGAATLGGTAWFDDISVIDLDSPANSYFLSRDKGTDYAADANPTWKLGATIANYGQSGDGGVYITASESNAPYVSVFDHAGSPWDTITTRLRLGNLNGFLGYATDIYGIAIGETTKYLKYDTTNGLRVAGDITATTGYFNTVTLGKTGVASGTLTLQLNGGSGDTYINSGKTDFTNVDTGFILGLDDSDSDKAKFYIGSSSSYLNWDGSAVTVAGSITTTSGAIGGFTIGATTLSAVSGGNTVIVSSGATAFTAGPTGAPTFTVTQAGVMTCTGASVSGGITTTAGSSLDGQYLAAASVASAAANLALRGWMQTSAFSVTDADTVAWGAGTFTASDGTAYSINAGNTGNMAAKTYIYLDIAASTTAYQTTTTAATAVGNGKVLVAVAQNGTGEASYRLMNDKSGNIDAADIVAGSITANEIATSTITADRMSVSQLSAVAADMGVLTAGTITLSSSGHIKAGQTDYDTGTGFWLGIATGPTAKFSIGNSAGDKMTWDGSELRVNGSRLSNEHIFGDGADGDLTTSGDVTLTKDTYYDDLTVSTGNTLYTAGYYLYVRGTLTVSGSIVRNGNNGGNGGNAVGADFGPGGTAGTALSSGTLYGSLAGEPGGNGGNFGHPSGYDGDAGANQTIATISTAASAGGDGGNGGGGGVNKGVGGIAGTTTLATRHNPSTITYIQTMQEAASTSLLRACAASGGGGGGGYGAVGGGSGGCGGGGGGSGSTAGIMVICAKAITVNSGGVIRLQGGTGGNGGNGSTGGGAGSGGGGGGGGGAGGNGGLLGLVYSSYSNSGTVEVPGGTGGTGGSGGVGDTYTGGNGSNGTAGNTGRIIQLRV